MLLRIFFQMYHVELSTEIVQVLAQHFAYLMFNDDHVNLECYAVQICNFFSTFRRISVLSSLGLRCP